MRPYQYIIDDLAAALALMDLEQDKLIGFDTETTGLNPLDWNVRLRLVQLAGSRMVYVFDIDRLGQDIKRLLKEFLERPDKIFIAHNLKFDLKFVRWFLGVKYFRKGICTMLGSQLANCGILEIPSDLESCCQRYLNIKLDKSLQESNWNRPGLDPEQIMYAARDADVLLDLWPVMAKKLVSQGQMYVAQLEFDAVDAVASLELNGLGLHEERWRTLCADVDRDYDEKKRELQQMLAYDDPKRPTLFGPESRYINLGSSQQLIKALEYHGVPIPLDDKTGHKTTGKHKMNGLALDYPVVNYLRKFRELEKLRSSYGLFWLDLRDPFTGRLHMDIHQIGAKTGRMAISRIQQVPTDLRYRNCFVADPGRRIVNGDYAQFELVILAFLSGDRGMIDAFESGEDFHVFTGRKLFKQQDLTPKQRGMAKNNNYADTYGAGSQRFALMCGITLEEAKEVKAADREAFPRKHAWLDRAGKQAIRDGFSRTLSGRIAEWIFDANDMGSVAATQRNGKNTPIQGLNADVTKRALKLVNDEIQGDDEIKMVHVVHDEILLEPTEDAVPRAEAMLKELMHQAGREFIRGVPIKVDTHIAQEWSK